MPLGLRFVAGSTSIGGENESAIADCNRAIAIDSQLTMGYYQRGRAEIAEQQWGAATKDFNQVLAIDSGETGAYYWLALAGFKSGTYADALTAVDRYIKANADDGDGHLLRAQIEVKLGNAAEARASATTAVRHYRIDNDQDAATKAQALLDSLGSAAAPSSSPTPR